MLSFSAIWRFEQPSIISPATCVWRGVSGKNRSSGEMRSTMVTSGAPITRLASRSIFNRVPDPVRGARAAITPVGIGSWRASRKSSNADDTASRILGSTDIQKETSMTTIPLEITNFFLAMQAGPSGAKILGDLFAPEAEYSEPFSGLSTAHKGRDAILAAFAASRTDDFDDAVIKLGSVEVAGNTITVRWTCYSKAIPGGSGSGTNVFKLSDGKIVSLVTTLDQA